MTSRKKNNRRESIKNNCMINMLKIIFLAMQLTKITDLKILKIIYLQSILKKEMAIEQ
jgi:hypothetical protein